MSTTITKKSVIAVFQPSCSLWSLWPGLRVLCGLIVFVTFVVTTEAQAQPLPPELTRPVNDFAGVIDAESARQMESLIRSLEQMTGDVVVVATIETFAPYADIREYATKMFENHGRGIGQLDKAQPRKDGPVRQDNGLLVLIAVKDRGAWIEVGYDLEQFITDGFAGETTRQVMAPEFKRGAYGAGLLAGVSRVIGRIGEGRNVTLDGVQAPTRSRRRGRNTGWGGNLSGTLFVLFIVINIIAGRVRRRRGRRWGGGGGWSSGVGPFGGGFGGFGGGFGGFGGGGGGGGGGGFGGFGGGRSGGGGGGGSW